MVNGRGVSAEPSAAFRTAPPILPSTEPVTQAFSQGGLHNLVVIQIRSASMAPPSLAVVLRTVSMPQAEQSFDVHFASFFHRLTLTFASRSASFLRSASV